MTTKEKIKQYIDYKGISKNKFYTITGLSTSFLDSGNTIGVDKAKIIIEKFSDLSMDWLILDRGPMLKDEGLMLKNSDKNLSPNADNRLWALIESQQRQLESQQRTIEALTKKGDVGDVRAVAR